MWQAVATAMWRMTKAEAGSAQALRRMTRLALRRSRRQSEAALPGSLRKYRWVQAARRTRRWCVSPAGCRCCPGGCPGCCRRGPSTMRPRTIEARRPPCQGRTPAARSPTTGAPQATRPPPPQHAAPHRAGRQCAGRQRAAPQLGAPQYERRQHAGPGKPCQRSRARCLGGRFECRRAGRRPAPRGIARTQELSANHE